MSKQKGHGRKFQPEVNRGRRGQVTQVYADLFPDDARTIYERVREFDTAYLEAHPNVREFVRRYVPGESYPQHDPDVHYVVVMRMGKYHRARASLVERPMDKLFVEVPEDIDEL